MAILAAPVVINWCLPSEEEKAINHFSVRVSSTDVMVDFLAGIQLLRAKMEGKTERVKMEM